MHIRVYAHGKTFGTHHGEVFAQRVGGATRLTSTRDLHRLRRGLALIMFFICQASLDRGTEDGSAQDGCWGGEGGRE